MEKYMVSGGVVRRVPVRKINHIERLNHSPWVPHDIGTSTRKAPETVRSGVRHK